MTIIVNIGFVMIIVIVITIIIVNTDIFSDCNECWDHAEGGRDREDGAVLQAAPGRVGA